MKKSIINILLTFSFITFKASVYSQITHTGNYRTGSDFVGVNSGTGGPLDIRNDFNPSKPIDFYINNQYFLSIIAGTSREGDLTVVQPTNGYEIGDWTAATPTNHLVLWHNGNINNIFVGVGAGNLSAANCNTNVGYNTGILNSTNPSIDNSGSSNTFVGYTAGTNNNYGADNSFYGDSAGFNNTVGHHNTYIGAMAGFLNTTGDASTYVGMEAGKTNNNNYNTMVGRNAGTFNGSGEYDCFFGKDAGMWDYGDANCFYGHHSGKNDNYGSIYSHPGLKNNESYYGHLTGVNWQTGNYNCLFGAFTAQNTLEGDSNVFIGADVQQSSSALPLHNRAAIGFGTESTSDRTFILGNNLQNVGIGLSNDLTLFGPRSKLEINADLNSTNINPITGSGLQFRQLTSISPNNNKTWFAPNGRVLTVDGDGIVKLTDNFGYGLCHDPYGQGPTYLPDDISMNLAHFRIYYTGQSYPTVAFQMQDAIGLGYFCNDFLPGKLSVDQNNSDPSLDNVLVSTTAGYFRNNDFTKETCPPSNMSKRGVYSISEGQTPIPDYCRGTFENVGGDFEARNCTAFNIGVRGTTKNNPGQLIGMANYGGVFQGSHSQNSNIGVFAGTTVQGAVNYGIYAFASPGTCTSGSCVQAAGYFNGDVYTTSTYVSSDANLKDNIQPLQDPLSIIGSLNPKTYTFKTSQFPYLSLPDNQQAGFIAQDVQQILPWLVKEFRLPVRPDSSGGLDTSGTNSSYLALNYTGLIPYLIGAVKQQQTNIDSLEQLISNFQNQLDNCCGAGLRMGNNNNQNSNNRPTINVELTNINTIILDQNSPNPFNEETYINYTVPKEVSKALIMIYDNAGQVLRRIIINDRGNGAIHIFAEKLSSGIYSYSLIADGKTIDTKKMVCQK